MKKILFAKISKGFDFYGIKLNYNKIMLTKTCLAKFKKRLSKLYKQILKCKSNNCKN